MPYQFKFTSPTTDFSCNIETKRCEGINKNGLRCKRKVGIGTPLCFSHLEKTKQIKIKKSTLPDAGKGLFAVNKQKEPNEIIFRQGDTIIPYAGEKNVTNQELTNRYGDYTAPYAVQYSDNKNEDAACKRGVGSLANRNRGNLNNARLYPNRRNGSIFLRATKNIRNNNEIFVPYGRHYRLNEEGVSNQTKYK